MKEHIVVSIIMPCYNVEAYIAEAIESVLSQTYTKWELIVVDDCSTDNSIYIIQEYEKKDSRIHLIQLLKNQGVGHARNDGIDYARGRYIAFLDADDVWYPQKLQKQLQIMQEESCTFSYCAYEVVDAEGNNIGVYHVKEKTTYQDMLKTSTMGTSTILYDIEILGKHYFKNIGHEDYIWKLYFLKKIPYATGIQEPLGAYRRHSHSLSSHKFKAVQWQWHIYRKVENLSLFKSMYYFSHYALNGLIKYA